MSEWVALTLPGWFLSFWCWPLASCSYDQVPALLPSPAECGAARQAGDSAMLIRCVDNYPEDVPEAAKARAVALWNVGVS